MQPLDVGISKPFKTRLQELVENKRIENGLIGRQEIAEMIRDSWYALPQGIVLNAWRSPI